MDSAHSRGTAPAKSTQVVLLGTGSPRPDPNRSGPATAIVVNDTPYLVDFGPGVIRRASAAYQKGVRGFGPGVSNLKVAFLTHLHSDHTMGYPDLIFTPWLMGRQEPLSVFGPKGLSDMTDNILKAWQIDLRVRTHGEHARPPCKVNVCEIAAGTVYKDDNITVKAFPVRHGQMESFGYRLETADRTIVISGDTAPTPALVEHCADCDVLIHEAYPLATFNNIAPAWKEFRRTHHTSSLELAELAKTVKPSLLVLYHPSNAGGGLAGIDADKALIQEIQQVYSGNVVTGRDLDVY